MKCPHCTVSFHDHWSNASILNRGHPTGWYVGVTTCPSCNNNIIRTTYGGDVPFNPVTEKSFAWRLIYPAGANRGPVPVEVPRAIAEDYIEADRVLPISPKASAALARRCLQNVLHSNDYRGRDLYREIQQLIDEPDPRKAIPESLIVTIDGIRHFGNFSAHPITDVTSLQVIDVEPHEAEWCLDILDEVFQHFYVRPAKALARKAELDAKLVAAGKLPAP